MSVLDGKQNAGDFRLHSFVLAHAHRATTRRPRQQIHACHLTTEHLISRCDLMQSIIRGTSSVQDPFKIPISFTRTSMAQTRERPCRVCHSCVRL